MAEQGRLTRYQVDFKGSQGGMMVRKTIKELEAVCEKLLLTGAPIVPYFPSDVTHLDNVGRQLLKESEGLEMFQSLGVSDP